MRHLDSIAAMRHLAAVNHGGEDMVRLIKRYGGGSRKLYDTEESRYVSLDEIEGWVRYGQQLRVVDSASGEDVTAQTLAQVIFESHKSGTAMLSTDFLHDAIRRGGRAISQRVEALQSGVDRLARKAAAKLPSAGMRAEIESLRLSLTSLEQSIANMESAGARPRAARGNGSPKAATGRRGRRA
jgi:polyhydroxyalkanoate synthesis repressor PhaR